MSNRISWTVGIVVISLGLGLLAAAQTATAPQLVKDAYPTLSSGALASAKLAVLPTGVLLQSGELQITQKDIDAELTKAPAQVRTQLKNNEFFLLENHATKPLVLAEAKAWAKQTNRALAGDDALIQAYIDDLVAKVAVTDDEIKVFYFDNKDAMGGATLDQVTNDVRAYLLDEKRQAAVRTHINTVSDRTSVEVNKAWVALQAVRAANNPVDKARKSGKPTFADFGADWCQPCQMMVSVLADVKKEYAGKLNVVFINVDKEEVLSARFGVKPIPCQIFYDAAGKEVFRHEGYFSKEQVKAKLTEIGVK